MVVLNSYWQRLHSWAYIPARGRRLVGSCPPKCGQITPKRKFIYNANQGVYTGIFKSSVFKIYFVLRPLLHCVLAWSLSWVSSVWQMVVGWIFGNICPRLHFNRSQEMNGMNDDVNSFQWRDIAEFHNGCCSWRNTCTRHQAKIPSCGGTPLASCLDYALTNLF